MQKGLHLFENPLGTGCSEDEQNDIKTDPRYNLVKDYKVSEFELMNNQGILKQLDDLPLYSDSEQDPPRKDRIFNMYGRATIPWKLSCETKVGY